MVEEHLNLCLAAGINHEASTPKWQRASGNSRSSARARKKAADEMWMARYLMLRLTEKYGVDIEFHCKPLGDTDWNGSACTPISRPPICAKSAGKEYFEKLMKASKPTAPITSRSTVRITTCV